MVTHSYLIRSRVYATGSAYKRAYNGACEGRVFHGSIEGSIIQSARGSLLPCQGLVEVGHGVVANVQPAILQRPMRP